jgi:hypothetical protein
MVTTGTIVPRGRGPEPEGRAKLSKQEKLIGIGLLIFYIAMIGVTIATSPYFLNGANRSILERASSSF